MTQEIPGTSALAVPAEAGDAGVAVADACQPASPWRRRATEWLRVIGTVGAGQAAIQGVGFLCGIFIVRSIPPAEYALYTLANAMIGTLNVLADVGVASGVMASGGAVWQDRKRLGAVIRTGLTLRRRFALLVVTLACPVLVYLLRLHGAGWGTVAWLIAGVVATYTLAVGGDLFSVAPKLHQNLQPLQVTGVVASVLRLITLLAILPWFPTAPAAVTIALAAQLWLNHRLRILTQWHADLEQPQDPAVRSAILKVVGRVLPGALYNGLSSQVSVWLLSVFGTGLAVAQVGALGRLGQLIMVATYFIATTIEPRFARLPDDRGLLRRRFVQVEVLLLLGATAAVLLAARFPHQIVWLLGANYRGLHTEVPLLVACSCAWLMSGVAFSLPAARGWVLNPAVSIVSLVLVQAAAVFLGNPATVSGVLWISLWGAFGQWVMLTGYMFWRCGAR